MSRNVPASVRQRLRDLATRRNEDFGLILTKYGLERVLFRLSRSKHRDAFVLKGALLFELWTQERHRPTRDADFLAYGPNDIERFVDIFRGVCSDDFTEDGLTFDVGGIEGERIKEDADYEGIRIQFVANLANVRIPIQIDIGFGDAITPAPVQVEYPTLLNLPAPVLSAYPRETVVAEKLEAMVKLGMANSRMKDFHDVASLAQLFEFDGATLARAITETFVRRKTDIPVSIPTAFTAEFYGDETKRRQWDAFIRRNRLYIESRDLSEIAAGVAVFLRPPLEALASGRSFDATWQPGGPWSSSAAEHEGSS
jgi:Nucleotidyl transferase AbiEii toxin, Type IV TA system